MKKFFEKYKGYVIALLMVVGITTLGFGLDFDQSQILWRGKAAPAFIAIGAAMFAGGFVLLCTASNRK